MENTKLDLSGVDTWDLRRELVNRGYFMDLVYSVHDVEYQLESINDNRDDEDGNKIVLDEYERSEILGNCISLDYYSQRINEDIEEYILDNYDNEDYYQKKENVE